MATVHYVDGEFHVHKAVVEEAKKAGPEQSPFSVKKEQSPNDHLISFIIPLTFKKVLLNVYFNRLSIPLIPADLETDFPPPKVVG